MKPFQIFKPGKHTAMSGTTLDFSEDLLRAAVEAYDPTLHEAPIVVGHPKDNGPAYGWIKSLSFADGAIVVEPAQVDEAFSEMVQAGRFKKRSASWYLPDSPNNPKPGTLYLRHVGFLGAMPPAVKGLKEVAFNEADEGVVEFADVPRYTWASLASLFRGLRDWLIEEKGLEKANALVPSYLVADLDSAANTPVTESNPLPGFPAYSEETPVTIDELKAQVAALTTERDTLKTQAANFSERETDLANREQALRNTQHALQRTAVEGRVDAAIKAGRLLPAQKAHAVDFAMSLQEGEAVMNFGEGDKAEKVTQREAYLRGIEASPVVVDYSERSAATGAAPTDKSADPQALADRARALIADAAKSGRAMDYTEAVAAAMTEFSAE